MNIRQCAAAIALFAVLVSGSALADNINGTAFANYYQKALALRGIEGTPALIRTLSDPDVTLRLYAAQALGERRDSAAIGPLTAALGDTNSAVRFHAARSLALLGSNAGIGVLWEALANGSNPSEAVEAAGLLADLGDPVGYRYVIQALTSGALVVQSRAVSDLLKFQRFDGQPSEVGPISVLGALSAVIDSPTAPSVRVNAIYAMARTGDKRAVAPLTKASQSPDAPVSKAAAVALAMIDAKR